MLHDLLNLHHNQVNINNENSESNANANANANSTTVFLQCDTDAFWNRNALLPFPQVHASHANLLKWYTNKKDEISEKRKKKIKIKKDHFIRQTVESMSKYVTKKQRN